MNNIRTQIDDSIVKKILGNSQNAINFLERLKLQTNISELNLLKKAELAKQAHSLVVKYWDYEVCKDIVRSLFKNSPKFKSGLEGEMVIDILFKEWLELELGEVKWPFSQGQFDAFVQSLNSEKVGRIEKDDKVKLASVRYRRLKEINTVRNDFIETLIFNSNQSILPTISHSKGVDFFIDGVAFDQKVSRSTTNEFKRDFGKEWKQKAIENPELVAKYLYMYQDEGRFGAEPRLFIVYLDENVPVMKIKEQILKTNLSKPFDIIFDYQHKSQGVKKTYKTQALVILISD
jgi:hypothetical protein